MISLEAKVVDRLPNFIELTIDDVMSRDWSLFTKKRDVDYSKGRIVSRRFYGSINSDGTFNDSDLEFKIRYEDELNPDGTLKEYVISNTNYFVIKTIKEIVLKPEADAHEIASHIQVLEKRVEKSKVFRKRRKAIIYNMKANNVNTSIEGSVSELSKHYSAEIKMYEDDGTFDFRDAVILDYNNGVAPTDPQKLIIFNHLSSKMIIGFDGVIGATSGTTPLYYGIPDGSGGYTDLLLKDIILMTISNWTN